MKGFALLADKWTGYANPEAGHDVEDEPREGDYTRRMVENAVQAMRDNGILACACPWEVLEGTEDTMDIEEQMTAAKTLLTNWGATEVVCVLVQLDWQTGLASHDDRRIFYDLRSLSGLATATTVQGVASASPIDDNVVFPAEYLPIVNDYLTEAYNDLDPAYALSDCHAILVRMFNLANEDHADFKTSEGLDVCSNWLLAACQEVA